MPKRKADRKALVLQAPRGMHDILPQDQPWWDRVYKVARDSADFYNFSRIETPVLEYASLYVKGIGEETDIVEHEMYVLKTKGGDALALRPEYTAGVVRSYMEHHLGRGGQPQKLFQWGPVFRHESPQAGRFRQFTQIGFEMVGGPNDPVYDAQIIIVFDRLIKDLKIKNTALKVNSIGCRVCRPIYKRQLQNYYKNYEKKLCAHCERRLKSNPLRLFDCKHPDCEPLKAAAPNFFDKLCVTCSGHLKCVLEYLDEMSIPYSLDSRLVRGLDYYSRTVFEFLVEGKGAEAGALLGGGRYDYLIEMLGGRLTPAVGGAAGVERLIHVMKAQEVKLSPKTPKKVFVIHVGELAKKRVLRIIEDLRDAGISVSEALGKESLKAQLKVADKEEIEIALILGQREIFEGTIIVRNLKSSLQETVSLATLVDEIKRRK